MITKYFAKVVVRFDPFSPAARPARLFLSRIPPALKGSCVIKHKVLTPASTEKPTIEVTYKDKFQTSVDPSTMTFNDVSAHFDNHSRKLVIQESISG